MSDVFSSTFITSDLENSRTMFKLAIMFKLVITSLFIATSTATIPPNPGYPPCSVCGPGMKVGNATAPVVVTTKDPTTCGFLQQAGLLGYVKTTECPFVVVIAKAACSCVKGQATLSPASKPYTVAPKPSFKPTKKPTRKPSLRPTIKV
jgi:hypothetical protein